MAREPQDLLSRFLDGETPDDAGARDLAEALDEPAVLRAAREDLTTEIILQALLTPEEELRCSRDRLLARAVRRGRRRGWALTCRSPRHAVAWAIAAAIAIVFSVGVHRWLTQPRSYPGISGQGGTTVGPRLVQAGSGQTPVARGQRVVAGPGGARLTLGGYCDLELDRGTKVVVRGSPGKEVVQLDLGRMVSKVTPGQGSYSVLTPAGELEVKGTEFVTTVEPWEGTETEPGSVVVSVAVLAGAVGFDFGGETGVLSAGAQRVFGAEAGAEAGTPSRLQSKTGVVKRVDQDAGVIVVMVTRELTFTITEDTEITAGDALRTLADIRVGDTVSVVYAFDPDRNRVALHVTITGREEKERR